MFGIAATLMAAFVLFLPVAPAASMNSAPAREALTELVGAKIARQVHFSYLPSASAGDVFRISGKSGAIEISGSSNVALLTGFNWYLKYVAHGQLSTNGDQLALPAELPAPSSAIEIRSPYRYRYALNENTSGYSSPYWQLPRWKHEIDLMAANGVNTVLIERGADLVLYETFRDFGYTDQEIRNWITLPAHQNWQLMGNMYGFGGPISMALLKKRAQSAKELLAYMRRLGITPVLPGYYGMVPTGFAQKHPGAHVIAQGKWGGHNGFTRPDWLDPRDPLFAKIASDFYRHQRELFGDTSIYDMEVFQEGGTPGDVPVGAGSVAIQSALESSHPGAYWMMLAWQGNPRPALINAVDRSKLMIVDEQLNNDLRHNPEIEYKGAPYLYSAIWDFGGRNVLGAHLQTFAKRIPKWGMAPGSHMQGIAFYNEGLDTDPAAFAFFMEMAWHTQPVDVSHWFSAYAERRYGGRDAHADRAWQILVNTAYHMPADREAAQDSVFNTRPSLTAGYSWGGKDIVYNTAEFESALPELLAVAPKLRTTETYRYDLVNLTRQVIDNRGRALLPGIKAAFDAKDQTQFALLTHEWLRLMKEEDSLLATNKWFLLGPWLDATKPWASNSVEKKALDYDMHSILTTWGGRGPAEDLHDYANKDWSGLVGTLYYQRWKSYFDDLDTALKTNSNPKPIDWFAMEDAWNRQPDHFALVPHGDAYAQASAIYKELRSRHADWSNAAQTQH
ncbi:MAG: alpha-N-acetylglucosaminidase [Acidobacteriaceae bacterium]